MEILFISGVAVQYVHFFFFFVGYVVEKCEEGSNYWEKVPGVVNKESITAKGLKEGKNYKFRVKAENIYGTGEPLESQKITAKNPFGELNRRLLMPSVCIRQHCI